MSSKEKHPASNRARDLRSLGGSYPGSAYDLSNRAKPERPKIKHHGPRNSPGPGSAYDLSTRPKW